ncbi:MAG: lactate utilization protein [Thermoplasmata archaeon YP2-bin.285]|uniref:Lactate utilization protein n=1 Tax=Candidatus Sysuiplasma superficiale TaxID=2823368 RepID=A0A8J8CFD6_9ARCH|nr:lactate utilization protein [Candidatus Sysuiplasma superficiale]
MKSEWDIAIERATANNAPAVFSALSNFSYIENARSRLKEAKSKVIDNMEYYIGKTMESVRRVGGTAYLARDLEDARRRILEIIGERRKIILGKSSVAFEIGLRKFLKENGKDVWETDFGELLLQISDEEPSHIITVALHMTRERFAHNLHEKLDRNIDEKSTASEMADSVRNFLRNKFQEAEIGITGANAISADTGTVVLVENEGNIRMTTVKPPVHIVITGVDKIVPTMEDAFNEAMVQSAYAGSFPPTYINFTSGPSSTGDIEAEVIRPATGPKDLFVILLDNGRLNASSDPKMKEALMCIRCGRCYYSCPVYSILGKDWGKSPYSGPTGVMWNYITTGDSVPSHLCTHSGGCKVVCPMDINIPGILEYLKWKNISGMKSDSTEE